MVYVENMFYSIFFARCTLVFSVCNFCFYGGLNFINE